MNISSFTTQSGGSGAHIWFVNRFSIHVKMLSSSSVNSSSYLNIDSKHSILRHRSNSGSILNDETPIQWKNINSFDIKRAELADSAKLNKTEPLETKFIQSCLQPSL